MQCLSGRQLLSHAVSSTHVAPQITPRPLSCANVNVTVARGALRRLVMVRAESTDTSTSTSTAEPELEPPASEDDEFAISPTPPAPKSLITEDNIISALTGDGKLPHFTPFQFLRMNRTPALKRAFRVRITNQ